MKKYFSFLIALAAAGFSAPLWACPSNLACPRGATCTDASECVEPGSPDELGTTRDQLGLTTDPGEGTGETLTITGEGFKTSGTVSVTGEGEGFVNYGMTDAFSLDYTVTNPPFQADSTGAFESAVHGAGENVLNIEGKGFSGNGGMQNTFQAISNSDAGHAAVPALSSK